VGAGVGSFVEVAEGVLVTASEFSAGVGFGARATRAARTPAVAAANATVDARATAKVLNLGNLMSTHLARLTFQRSRHFATIRKLIDLY